MTWQMADVWLEDFYRKLGIFHAAYRNLQGQWPEQLEGWLIIFSFYKISGYGIMAY